MISLGSTIKQLLRSMLIPLLVKGSTQFNLHPPNSRKRKMKHIPRSDPATMPSPRPLLMRIFRQGTAKRKRGKQRDPRNPD